MNKVFIPLSLDGECQQKELSAALGSAELLSQLTEECAELIQAARRVLAGTTPVPRDKASQDLVEEAADVVLTLDMLTGLKLLDRAGVRFIGRCKTERWFRRVVVSGNQQQDEPGECIDRQKLLENVDVILDCNDMIFEGNRDHACHPAYAGLNLPRAREKPATPPENFRQPAGEGCQCKRETTYCEEHTKNV